MNITAAINKIEDFIEITTNSEALSIPSTGEPTALQIVSDVGWKIVEVPDFVTISTVRGRGDTITQLIFEPNDSLSESRIGHFKIINNTGDEKYITFTQEPATIEYQYSFEKITESLSFTGAVETAKTIEINSYKTAYVNGKIYEDYIPVNFTISTNVPWIEINDNKISTTENPNNIVRSGIITVTQEESVKTVNINVTQDASVITWKYKIEGTNEQTVDPEPNTVSIPISVYRQQFLNGKETDIVVNVDATSIAASNFITTSYSSQTLSVTSINNTSEEQRSGTITVTPVLDDTTQYPQHGTTPSLTVTITQSAGSKVYSDVAASLSYQTAAVAAGGTCSPTLTRSQTYTWNGVVNSGGSVDISNITIGSYSLSTTTGASIDTNTGVVTWTDNQSLSSRRSSDISVRITGLGNKTTTVTATCSQNEGYYTYGNITISTLSYSEVDAVGGQSSPSITYSQPYGWNGDTSNAGTVNGNGDDSYTTYAISTAQTGLSIESNTGVITWEKNNQTPGVQDSQRSGAVIATVSRNGKTATETVTVTQNEEVISSYSDWTFTATPSATTISAAGGSSVITISRPTRTITYDTGDTVTETATSGKFTITQSNTSFTLSDTSVDMTDSSLPTVMLSVSGTGAAAADSISSIVTVSFTVSDPTTGTTTASATTEAISRKKSEIVATNYRISTFSATKSSFTAAGGTTTLSIVVQRKYTYTDNQGGDWTTITPSNGTLSVSVGTGGSAGTITYGSTSTCTITVDSYTNTSSDRTISISGDYNSGQATSSTSISQTKDGVSTYGTPTISIGSGLNASGGSATVTSSVTNKYVSGRDVAGSVTLSLTSNGNNRFTLDGNTVSHDNMTTNNITDTVTITAYNQDDNTKSASASKSVTNNYTDSGGVVSYGNVTKGTITNKTIPASGTTTNYTATAGNGSQTWSKTKITRTFDSGSTSTVADATSGTNEVAPSVASISAKADSKDTTLSDLTIVKSQDVIWTGNGGKSASGTMYIYQEANTRAMTSIYLSPYQPDSSWIVTVSGGNWNTCPAGGGYVKCYGYCVYKYSSGKEKDELHTSDAALSWSGSPGWITNHVNGGYYISSRGTSVESARSSTATWSYSGFTSPGKTLTQEANAVINSSYSASTTWNTPNISIGSGIGPAGGSATVSHSQSGTTTYYYLYTSGSTSGPYYSYPSGSTSIAITSNGNNRFSLSGNTLSHSSMGTYEGTDTCTVTVTGSGSKTNSASVSATNTYSDSGGAISYGNISAGTITNATIPASGGSATAYAGNGSQTWSKASVTRSYASGSSKTIVSGTSGTSAVAPSASSYTASANSKGTTESSTTTVGSQYVAWRANGMVAGGTMYVYQAANTRTYGNVSVTSHGTAGDIPAWGGSAKALGGSGTQTISYTSGSTEAGTVTCGTYSTVSANSRGTTEGSRVKVGTSTATLTGQGGKTATASVDVYQSENKITSTSFSVNDHSSASISGSTSMISNIVLTMPTDTFYTIFTSTYSSGSTTSQNISEWDTSSNATVVASNTSTGASKTVTGDISRSDSSTTTTLTISTSLKLLTYDSFTVSFTVYPKNGSSIVYTSGKTVTHTFAGGLIRPF